MTTASDVPEVERLKASNQSLSEERDALVDEVRDLRWQLEEMRTLTPYDQPADVIAVLETLLPGWPACRWAQLARLIEEETTS